MNRTRENTRTGTSDIVERVQEFIRATNRWFELKELARAVGRTDRAFINALEAGLNEMASEENSKNPDTVCIAINHNGNRVYRKPFEQGERVKLARTDFTEVTGVEAEWLETANSYADSSRATNDEETLVKGMTYTVAIGDGHNVKLVENSKFNLNCYHFENAE